VRYARLSGAAKHPSGARPSKWIKSIKKQKDSVQYSAREDHFQVAICRSLSEYRLEAPVSFFGVDPRKCFYLFLPLRILDPFIASGTEGSRDFWAMKPFLCRQRDSNRFHFPELAREPVEALVDNLGE
jgi:hypothetical protein